MEQRCGYQVGIRQKKQSAADQSDYEENGRKQKPDTLKGAKSTVPIAQRRLLRHIRSGCLAKAERTQ